MKKANVVFNIFKIITIASLLWALYPDNPYSYYTLLRILVTIISAYSCYKAIQLKKETWAWIFGVIAVLFNPIFKIHLTKAIWGYIDIGVAVIYLVSVFCFKISKNNEN